MNDHTYYTNNYKKIKDYVIKEKLNYNIKEMAEISCYKWSILVEQVSPKQHLDISKLI